MGIRSRQLSVIIIGIALAPTACRHVGTEGDTADPLEQIERQPQAAAESPPSSPSPFTLLVTNQSFEHATVAIDIAIDGAAVVNQDFDVEGQHNVVQFDPSVAAGKHTMRVTSSTGATSTTEISIRDDEPQWAVVSYWFDPDEDTPHFTVNVTDEPPGFA